MSWWASTSSRSNLGGIGTMWIRSTLVSSLVISLLGCGSGSSTTQGSNSTLGGSQASPPTTGASANAALSVDFPLAGSLATQESISFVGQIEGLAPGSNAEVRVTSNGQVFSTTADSSGQWRVDAVTLEATTTGSYSINLYADGQLVDSGSLVLGFDGELVTFGLGDALTLDEDSNSAYLVDDLRLVQIDLISGQRSEIAQLPVQAQSISDLFWHSPSQRLFFLDQDGDLLAYEQTAGSWQSAELGQILSADAFAVADTSGEIFLLDSEAQVLNRYNANLQWIQQVSLPQISGDIEQVVALDSSQLVLISSSELVVFNPNTTQSQIFSSASLGLGNIDDATVDSASQQIYIRDASNNALWRLQLDLSAPEGLIAEQLDLGGVASYAMEFAEERGELLFSSSNRLLALDPNDFSVATLSETNWGSGVDWSVPSSIALSESGDELYVSDLANDDIYEVKLTSGSRQALNTSGDSLEAVSGMVQEGDNLYSVDLVRRSVLMTDIESGITADLALIGPGDPTLSEPIAIDLDEDRFRAFVLDRGLRAICEVSTVSGVASILASSDDAEALTLAISLIFDESTQSIYWSSWMDNSLHKLNLNTLESELVSGLARGSGPNFQRPGAVALNSEDGFAYVADFVDGRIFAVDLISGNRNLVLDTGALLSPDSMVYDSNRGLLQVLDTATGGVYVLEPVSGDLSLISL